jgi:type I restriction enzyme, S subunit
MSERLKSVPLSQLTEVNPSVPIGSAAPTMRVSFIPMTDVSDAGNWEHKQTRELRQVQSGYTRFVDGDVLFAKITPCMENGKGAHALGLVSGIGFGSTEFHVLRALPSVDGRFLFHWTQAAELRRAAEAMMTGSAGQRRVPADFFRRFRVPVLPLPEQRRIAEVLDTADEALRQTEALIAKLKQMKQGLLHDLLTRGLDENGELRDPVARPEQFKDSPLGRIPRGWEATTIRSCLTGNPQNGLYKPAEQIGRGALLIGQTSITADRTLDVSVARRAVTTSQELERFGLIEGDILVSRVFATLSGVGLPAYVTRLPEPGAFESNMMRLRPDRSVISPRLLFEVLRTKRVRATVAAVASLSNQASINQQGLNPIRIPVPPMAEQKNILKVLSAHDARIRAEEAYRDKLQLLKKGLMQDLLTGRVRVPVCEEEPELLEVGG